jgi:CRP-like cAMP-binding protein
VKNYKIYDVLFSLDSLPEKLMDKQYASKIVAALDECLIVTEHRHRYLLLNAGHISDYMYFIERGIARCFYFDDNVGREITSMIWREHCIVCDPLSFFQRKASEVNIEVMPDSLLLSISYWQLQDIFKAFPETEIFIRCISLQYTCYYAQRARELIGTSAWERYLHLLITHPGIELKVSKEIIASYLNITPQSLSRLIREKGHP